MIADSFTELEASRLLLLNAAYRKDSGYSYAMEASMAKMYATEAANRASYKAIQILEAMVIQGISPLKDSTGI